MIRRPTKSTRTDTLFPYTTLFRSPLTVGISGGYLNAKYKDFSLSGSEVLSDFDHGGQRMPRSPKWQYSINTNLDQPITDNLRLVSTVLGSYTGNMLFKYGAYPGVLDNPESDSRSEEHTSELQSLLRL